MKCFCSDTAIEESHFILVCIMGFQHVKCAHLSSGLQWSSVDKSKRMCNFPSEQKYILMHQLGCWARANVIPTGSEVIFAIHKDPV